LDENVGALPVAAQQGTGKTAQTGNVRFDELGLIAHCDTRRDDTQPPGGQCDRPPTLGPRSSPLLLPRFNHNPVNKDATLGLPGSSGLVVSQRALRTTLRSLLYSHKRRLRYSRRNSFVRLTE
jgi:hypothetical protein